MNALSRRFPGSMDTVAAMAFRGGELLLGLHAWIEKYMSF